MPNIMVFHNAKAVARFNGTERTLTNIAAFVTNVTGHYCYILLLVSYLMVLLGCVLCNSLSSLPFTLMSPSYLHIYCALKKCHPLTFAKTWLNIIQFQ